MKPAPARTPRAENDSFLFSDQSAEERRPAIVPRLFVREPGWHVHIKPGSERLFCYAIAPGDETYHRIADGEVYFQRGEERICAPCADRLGLLHYEPRVLKTPAREVNHSASAENDVYGLDEMNDN